jgi:hypothetical protein
MSSDCKPSHRGAPITDNHTRLSAGPPLVLDHQLIKGLTYYKMP